MLNKPLAYLPAYVPGVTLYEYGVGAQCRDWGASVAPFGYLSTATLSGAACGLLRAAAVPRANVTSAGAGWRVQVAAWAGKRFGAVRHDQGPRQFVAGAAGTSPAGVIPVDTAFFWRSMRPAICLEAVRACTAYVWPGVDQVD